MKGNKKIRRTLSLVLIFFFPCRIPERAVHARGVAVHGYFQSYEDWSNITAAKFLQDPDSKTPVFVRFSTVLGSRGSPDTVRDVRGFSTRFYTEEGNWDLGNVSHALKFRCLC